jgi:AraC-like DNA-binding protein
VTINYSLDKKAIPITQAQNLMQVLLANGFPLEKQLMGTGISQEIIANPGERITYRQRIKQLEVMLDLIGDRGFWLDLPRDVSISEYGLLGYAMMSSATLEQAVNIAVKYHKMAGAIFELTFLVEDDEAVLRVEHLMPVGRVAEYVVEDLFQGVTPLIQLMIGTDHKPTVVHLNYDRPDIGDRYELAFNCPVKFNQDWCEYRFDAELLKLPLAEANSETARICEQSCRKLLDQMDIEEDIVSRVSHLLLSTPGEFPKLDVIAERLSLGSRTLRRRLMELGTNYQKILDDVRKGLATEYLLTTNLSVQDISELLGYSEVTNFRRAFLKWSKVSPYQFRKNSGTDCSSI